MALGRSWKIPDVLIDYTEIWTMHNTLDNPSALVWSVVVVYSMLWSRESRYRAHLCTPAATKRGISFLHETSYMSVTSHQNEWLLLNIFLNFLHTKYYCEPLPMHLSILLFSWYKRTWGVRHWGLTIIKKTELASLIQQNVAFSRFLFQTEIFRIDMTQSLTEILQVVPVWFTCDQYVILVH